MAGFSKAILPFIVVVPGIIAFYLFQDRISDGDQAWPFMVKQFLPAGLVGLVLAGLASAIMSTLSAITNSSATIFTFDLYKLAWVLGGLGGIGEVLYLTYVHSKTIVRLEPPSDTNVSTCSRKGNPEEV